MNPELPNQVRAAILIIVSEALALVAAAAVLVFKTLTGHPLSLGNALVGALLAIGGAVVLGLCARGLDHARPAARTPVVVLQLLSLPVSYTLAFQADRVGYGAPIMIAALAVLYLLFTPPARAVFDRERPE